MSQIKKIFKRNSHSLIIKPLAGLGRAINRLYENRNHDITSNGEITVLMKISQTNPLVIIDGGANTGNYSAAVSRVMPGCTVYAFEPVKSTFDKLKENTRKYPNVIANRKGLFSRSCNMEINLFPADEHASIYDIEGPSYSTHTNETIELVRGDDFLKDNNIASVDLLKLDVEGAEYEVLLGFEESLKKGIIKAVQFEYGYINIKTKKLLIDYYELFGRHGYKVGKIYPKTVEFREYNYAHEDFIGPNYLAVKTGETRLVKLLSGK